MQFTTVGLLQNDILWCSLFEAEKTSSMCSRRILEYSPYTSLSTKTHYHLALQIQRNSTCNSNSGRIVNLL